MSEAVGRKKRHERGRRGGSAAASSSRRERERETTPSSVKTPIILAKHSPISSSGSGPSAGGEGSDRASSLDRANSQPLFTERSPMVLLRSRDDQMVPSTSSLSSQSGVIMVAREAGIQPQYILQQKSSAQDLQASFESKLASAPRMKSSIKLVDESLQWCDSGLDVLLEQTDYLVVGVLGLQGVGKSTVLSLLTETDHLNDLTRCVFKTGSDEKQESAQHQTTGVDMFVTGERMILLDTQPLLSASILDNVIQFDKKCPIDFNYMENYAELQSVQIASFLLTVCHVVIVVQDWFTDFNLLRLIQTAEMLKPSLPSMSHESGHPADGHSEYYPHIVFVQNKAGVDDFSIDALRSMDNTLSTVFHNSMLKYQGAASLSHGDVIPAVNGASRALTTNLFVLPWLESDLQSNAHAYLGRPSTKFLLTSLRNQLLSVTRHPLTRTPLSERNWFHYAARMLDAVKKSTLFSEYNRLLP